MHPSLLRPQPFSSKPLTLYFGPSFRLVPCSVLDLIALFPTPRSFQAIMTALTGRSLEPSVFTAWRFDSLSSVRGHACSDSLGHRSLSLHRALFSEAKSWRSRRLQFSSICLGFRWPCCRAMCVLALRFTRWWLENHSEEVGPGARQLQSEECDLGQRRMRWSGNSWPSGSKFEARRLGRGHAQARALGVQTCSLADPCLYDMFEEAGCRTTSWRKLVVFRPWGRHLQRGAATATRGSCWCASA